jgi:hypothetical protein
MAFKMKGINSLMNNNNLDKQVKRSSSPLFETNSELANLDYTDTDFAGDNIAVRGEAVIPGQKVEKQLVPEDFDGGENNPEYQKKLAALETAIEQGKADKYKDQKVVRERDYTKDLLEKYGRFYKEDNRGIKHIATPTDSGEYLTMYEAEKFFGGKDTPEYQKWWKTTPESQPGFMRPGKGIDYDPVFEDNSNLGDYTYSRVDE